MESGDLLLFRGGHFAGRLQRKLTKGVHDHAAMIIKMEGFVGQQIFFLHSVMDGGVTLTNWDEFIT